MSVKVKEIVNFLEDFAPSYLAETWDNTGLLAGDPESEVRKILLTLDVTPDIVNEAIAQKAQLIISHHPLIFSGLKNIAQTNWQNRMLVQLLSNNIAVYSAHTNLDVANGGVNDVLAEQIGLHQIELLQQQGSEQLYKIAVFVPAEHSEQVMFAMTKAGAGHIGQYSDCTFQTPGVGTFRPLSGSTPFIGTQGYLERVSEVRLETVVTAATKQNVLAEMLKAHPYEEVAHDIYQLKNIARPWGLGRIGSLPKKLTAQEFALQLKNALNIDSIAYADAGRKIKRVAVIGGAGSDFAQIALARGADALVTSDVKYHAAQNAKFSGLSLFDAGHQATEWPILQAVEKKFAQWENAKKIKVVIAKEQQILQHI